MVADKRLPFFTRFWVPEHQTTLGPVGEPLLDCQVTYQHRPHHMRSRGRARSLVLWMPITCHVQKEEALGTRVATHQERPPLVKPTIPTGATSPHTPLDFERVVARFGDAADERPVPPVAVPS